MGSQIGGEDMSKIGDNSASKLREALADIHKKTIKRHKDVRQEKPIVKEDPKSERD